MALYVPTSFGQLIKVGEKEDEDCGGTNEPRGSDEECDISYFKLILWELEKQLEIQTQRLKDVKKSTQTSLLEEGAPVVKWLSDFDTTKASVTPILYQLIEKKCSELLPQYAKGALHKFQTTDFGEMPLDDIPWTLLSILREQKLKQDEWNASATASTSIFNRIEQWLSWNQVVRNRVAPDIEAGDPFMTTKPDLEACSLTNGVSTTSHSQTFEMIPTPPSAEENRDVNKSAVEGSVEKPSSKRSLLNMKGRDFPFKKFPVSRRYSTLSDEASQALFAVASTSSEDFKEITLNSSDISGSSDDVTARGKVRAKLKQFKEDAVSIIGNFRYGRRFDSMSPI